MISNKFLVWIFLLALCACKSQTAVAPLVIRDSISITYKQGKEQPTSIDAQGAATSQFLWNQQRIAGDKEQPASLDAIGAAIESRKNSCVPADGSVGVGGATQGASVFEGLLSQRTNKKAVPPTPIIRVDTVFVERWHTQVLQPAGRSFSDSGPSESNANGLSAKRSQFYKNCTKGFWILLLLLLGRFAFRILKAIYLKR